MIAASLGLAGAQGTAHGPLSQTLAQGRQRSDGAFGSLGRLSVVLAVAVLPLSLSARFAMLLAGLRGQLSRPMRTRRLHDHAVAASGSRLLLTAPFARYRLRRSDAHAYSGHAKG